MTDTAIYMIIDGSGSMSGSKKEVVKGVNEFIVEQQVESAKMGSTTDFTLTVFDSKVSEVYTQEDISLVNPVSVSDTFLGGGTALLDAIGRTLTKAEDNSASRNLVVIYTDGEENTSREFSSDDVKKLIDKLDLTGKWQFIYLGAEFAEFSQDRAYAAVASSVNTSSVNTNKASTVGAFGNVSKTFSYMRSATADTYSNLSNREGGLMGAAVEDADVNWIGIAESEIVTTKKDKKDEGSE